MDNKLDIDIEKLAKALKKDSSSDKKELLELLKKRFRADSISIENLKSAIEARYKKNPENKNYFEKYLDCFFYKPVPAIEKKNGS